MRRGEQAQLVPSSLAQMTRQSLRSRAAPRQAGSVGSSAMSAVLGETSVPFSLQSAVDQKRASHHESNGFAGRIHLLPDLLQQSHSSSTSSTSSSPSSSQPTPTMSPQTPQDKLTTNEVCLTPQLAALPGLDQHRLGASLQRPSHALPSPALPAHLLLPPPLLSHPPPPPPVTCFRSVYRPLNPRAIALQTCQFTVSFSLDK